LSEEAGARLLETLGVKGTKPERERLAADVRGHALTLTIIGGYLRDAYGGDIRQRDRIKLDEADTEEQGGPPFAPWTPMRNGSRGTGRGVGRP
jgi:hypothetical protein